MDLFKRLFQTKPVHFAGSSIGFISKPTHKFPIAIIFIVLLIILLFATVEVTSLKKLVTGNGTIHRSSLNSKNDNNKQNLSSTQLNVTTGTNSQNSSGGNGGNSTDSDVNISVNGENISIPENGSVHKTIKSEDGNTNVDISRSTSNTGTSLNSNVSSSKVRVNSSVQANSSINIQEHTSN